VKKFILLSFLGTSVSLLAFYKVNVFDNHHLFRKCSGNNSHCSGCENCSGCEHCSKEGGTCAVCYTPRAVVRRGIPGKTSRPALSVLSNNVHTVLSGSSSVKRYDLKKSSARKNSSHTKIIDVQQPVPEFPSSHEIKPDFDVNISSMNAGELMKDLNPVPTSPILPEEKKPFSLDISENSEFVRVTSVFANLRERSSTQSPVLQKLGHGNLLIKFESVQGWVKVQTLDSGTIGYVASSLLE
jgi:hypothetical protein